MVVVLGFQTSQTADIKHTQMKRQTIVVLSFLAIIIVGLMYYIGIFARVHILEKDMGPYQLVYKQINSKDDIGKTIDEITDQLSSLGISPFKGYCVFDEDLNAPDKKAVAIFEAGCVLKQDDLGKIDTTKFKVKEFPKQFCVVSNFRYKMGLSVMLGKLKVYPALARYFKRKEYKQSPIMELYGPRSISYIIPAK